MSIVLGNYELLERVGQGGMGEVWRARHRTLGRMVAVKVIRPGALGGTPEQDRVVLARFEREARTAAALRSPHTLQIQDFGCADDGTFFQVMELLDGVDLQGLVERFGPLPPARIVTLLRQACDALAEAHARGFVHRDVKPSNLFLCRFGTQGDFLKVLDFGLARTGAAQDVLLTQAGALPGSPAYLPPEIIRGAEAPTDKADVYALGCVAWWLASGRLVFTARSSIDMIVGHLERPPGSLRELVPAVPEALSELVGACLAKDPAARPSVRELSRRLGALTMAPPWTEALADAWWDANAGAITTRMPIVEAAPPMVTPAGRPVGTPPALGAAREEAYATLRRHFEQSRIDVGDLEGRMARAAAATTPAAVQSALAGLPEAAVAVSAPATALAPVDPWRQTFTVLAATKRTGHWQPGPHTRMVTVLGSIELDLRDAELLPGCTEIRCVTAFGSAEITVPPDLYVEVAGMGVLGSFEGATGRTHKPAPGEAWVRITGVAVCGSVEVIVRARGGTTLQDVAAKGAEVIQKVVDQITEGAARGRERARRNRLPPPKDE